jgi:hypothetical protein
VFALVSRPRREYFGDVVALAFGAGLGFIFYLWWSRTAASGRLENAPRWARQAFPIAVGLVIVSFVTESIGGIYFVVPIVAMVIAGFDMAFLGGMWRARRIELRKERDTK